jgi:hypothetical protein
LNKATIITAIVFALFMQNAFAQNVSINSDGSIPEASAMLDVKSTDKGFLAARMTSAGDITSPATGLSAYQTGGTSGYYYYNDSNGIFFDADGSSGHYNWKISQQNQLDGGLTFAASTATGGTSFASPVLAINQNGRVGNGTTSMDYTLHVNGSVAGTSAYNNLSEARLKKDVEPIENGLNKVMALHTITFNWNKTINPELNLDDRNHIDFMAQELEAVLPQVISTGHDAIQTKSVAYGDVVPVLAKAIQEQQSEIESLKKELEELRKMIQSKKQYL